MIPSDLPVRPNWATVLIFSEGFTTLQIKRGRVSNAMGARWSRSPDGEWRSDAFLYNRVVPSPHHRWIAYDSKGDAVDWGPSVPEPFKALNFGNLK